MTKISGQFLISGQFQDSFKISGISGISGQLGALKYMITLKQTRSPSNAVCICILQYLTCNFDDLEPGQFKVIQGQRSTRDITCTFVLSWDELECNNVALGSLQFLAQASECDIAGVYWNSPASAAVQLASRLYRHPRDKPSTKYFSHQLMDDKSIKNLCKNTTFHNCNYNFCILQFHIS